MAGEIKIRTSSEYFTKPSGNSAAVRFTKEVINKGSLTIIVTNGIK